MLLVYVILLQTNVLYILQTLPGAGVAVALIDKAKKPFTPIAPVSGKVQVQLEKPKSG